MSAKIFIGNQAAELETSPAFEPYSKVILWYDDEKAFTAGDETGRTLEADCPWATQAMADALLESVKGYVYKPYFGQDALLDPAAELGDGVTIGGVYGPLASVTTVFDALCASDIEAPEDEEVNHEYPYLSPSQRALDRKLTLGSSYYGTKITRARGLEIASVDANGNEVASVVMNADELTFYRGSTKALYFDTRKKQYVFDGRLEAPYIDGGSIIGGDYWSSDENTKLDLLDEEETEIGFGAGMILYRNGGGTPIFSVASTVLVTQFRGFNNNEFLKVDALSARPQGKWNFAEADAVTGLYLRFS